MNRIQLQKEIQWAKTRDLQSFSSALSTELALEKRKAGEVLNDIF